jgi:hypothetical protein
MPTVTIGARTGSTYAGNDDTYINSAAATTNYGSGSELRCNWGTANQRKTLIKFGGLSSITAPVTVTAVSLTMHSASYAAPTQTLALHRVLRNWVENEATYTIYSTGNAWGTLGMAQDDADAVSVASGSFAGITDPNGDKVLTGTAGMIADVQGWINGTYSNYGWVMRATTEDTGSTSTRWWVPSENGTAANRPVLEVTYTEGGRVHPFAGKFGYPLMGKI